MQEESVCVVEGCGRRVRAYGLCRNHARAQMLYGNPLVLKQVQHHGISLRQRFFAHVKTTPTCWLWIGAKDMKGYGRINIQGSPELAHRVSWLLEHGSMPLHGYILHRCDRPSCVNPLHLFVGNQQDNMDDKMLKGRHRYGTSFGEAHGKAKLTEENVREILTSTEPAGALARKYGLAWDTMNAIIQRKTWQHVEVEGAIPREARTQTPRYQPDTTGSANGQAKLTEDSVRQIRDSTETYATLAARYGVSKATIKMIRLRQRWQHVS